MTPKQNPPEAVQSSEQQMGSNDVERITNAQPFSIREYVLTVRQKDICRNWPFSEEYLHFCLNHGIRRVLPPFEHCDSVHHPSHRENMGTNCAQDINAHDDSVHKSRLAIDGEQQGVGIDGYMDDEILDVSKKVCLLSLSKNHHEHGEVDPSFDIMLNPMVTKVHPSIPEANLNNHINLKLASLPSTKGIKKKRRRRKGKPKKRSMVDICAEAKPCILVDPDRMVGLKWDADLSAKADYFNLDFVRSEDYVDEGNACLKNEHGRKYDSMDGIWDKKHPRDDDASDGRPLRKKRGITKMKLSVYKSQSPNRKLCSLRTVDNMVPEASIKNSTISDVSTSILKVQHASQGQRKDNPEVCGALSVKDINKSKESEDHSKAMELTTTYTKCLKDSKISNSAQHLPVISVENRNPKGRRQRGVRRSRHTISSGTCPVYSGNPLN